MTTEDMAPQQEMGQAQEAGPAQAQGHRRRRRRRKNKSQQSAAQPAAQPQPQSQAPAPPPPPTPRPQQQPQARKKKKFFEKRTQQPQPGPGNSIAPQGQAKRRTRQKGPREFVGPMDHSYRVVNGNVADSPPSTIQMNTNYGNPGNYYADPAATAAATAVRLDAPTRIFCFIEDLFFLAKIQETARKLGVKVEFIKGADKDAIARITDAPEGERAALIVFDLNNLNAKPMTLIPKLKTKLKRSVSIIGFLSHIQGDLKLKATEAGCDTVMPRSAFSQSLPNLLRRYGIEDEEEYSPQPA